MNSALGDYTYVNSASSKWLSNKDGYYQIIDSPPNSEILNYTGKYMIILETYKGDLDNSVINRVWTNSSAVKSFIGAQNAGVYSIYTWFGSDRGNINIYNVGPANGNSIKIPSYLDYVAKFLKANGYWTYIKSIMNWYFANSVDVGTIDEFRKTQNGRIYQDGKFIRRVDKQADVIYEPTDLTSFAQNNGGASFNFDYNSYGTSKSLTSGAQVVYTVFHDGYNAFLWSDKVYNSWTQ
ncbi:hypothetical protein [Clostridium thermarum]|nr:hypothetical protein [Clostridium thermarum]